jgi:hypothetical protein
LFSLLAIGMLSLASMIHFPSEMAIADDSSGGLPTVLSSASENAVVPISAGRQAGLVPSAIASVSKLGSPEFHWLVLGSAPIVAFLLILISRWRLPISPPVDDDPARYLRRSLL